MRILVIEDDPETLEYVSARLAELGHAVSRAANGRDGLFLAGDGSFDLLIVDRMLPGMDGLAVVSALRAAGVDTPVLFLTTLGEVPHRVAGLAAGGDDYLAKPFAFAELAARVEALGRRARTLTETKLLRVGDLELDRAARSVKRAGKPIELLPREFQVLEYLMRHAGQVVTRTMLLENVWDLHFDPHTNVVDNHIARLRAKIDKGQPHELIHTVRGVGFMIRAPD
ncbi:MAG TPA: response regulator transcription factor [Acetobacteraceae bacterium]|nr:response regulator transcription factor [Acetobacteraceae bacterium]